MPSARKSGARRRFTPAELALIGVVAAALIAAVGGIIVALIQAGVLRCCLPPTPTPRPTATNTPTPTDTPTPTPTDTPTVTPTQVPLAWITYPALSADAPTLTTRFIDLMGEYDPGLTDSIWVFVQDMNGFYYPESMEPCSGKTVTQNTDTHQWEIYLGVGVDGDSGLFHVVLTTASPRAATLLANALREGCRTGVFPSYKELPPEVTEQQRVAVTREPVIGVNNKYPSMPPVPDAGLAGVVSVAAFGGDGVSIEEEINGTTSQAKGAVWALVFTFYGRWFPQSYSPCKSIHTQQTGDEWRAKTIFGGSDDAGMPFYLAVVLADDAAGKFLDQQQRTFCAEGSYPGFMTIELPAGLSLKYSTRVIRK